MAAADTSLSREFECAICSDQLERPKFIGPCNHTFCRNCIDQLWVSHGRKRKIPCPQCREDCRIPSEGGDGLKDNFMVANIIERFRTQKERTAPLAEVRCTLCPNGASSACKECDLKMCPGCKCQHVLDPLTPDHEIFGLCSSHGNGVFFFCTSCKQAVCSACKISEHNQGDHDVTPIRQVVDDLMSKIQASSIALEDGVEEEDKKLAKLRDTVRILETRTKEWKTQLDVGWAARCTKITIDTESIAYLTSISLELMESVKASKESSTRTVTDEVTKSIGELELVIGHLVQGVTVMNVDRHIRRGEAKRVFRQLKKVCNVTFQRDRPCEEVCKLKYLLLPDSCLAVLGISHGARHVAGTIFFIDEASSSVTGRITEGFHLAMDMAVLSTGDVVVARQEKPPLRVFTRATGTHRNININHDGKVIDKLWNVETDESDNMFVLTGLSNPLLLVVKPSGSVIQSVQLRGDVYSMAFRSLNRILYIAARTRILRFHWSNNILTEISSSSNGVARFECYEFGIGSGGEVLVVGWMGMGKIVIYQVEEGDDDENVAFREVEYQDGVNRTSYNWPHICINDDNLWLGFNNQIEKFQLV